MSVLLLKSFSGWEEGEGDRLRQKLGDEWRRSADGSGAVSSSLRAGYSHDMDSHLWVLRESSREGQRRRAANAHRYLGGPPAERLLQSARYCNYEKQWRTSCCDVMFQLEGG